MSVTNRDQGSRRRDANAVSRLLQTPDTVRMRDVIARVLSRFALRSLALAIACVTLAAHVGTEMVVFEGQAGGYPIRVIIRPQGVVPAQVPIVIRVLNGSPTRVTVRAAQWNVGTKGAPPAEVAALVPGEPNTYAHDLWIMTSSAYAIHVAVEGSAGAGELLVPMQSLATRTRAMPRVTGSVLVVLAALLVIGMLTIVGAAAREGTLAKGIAADAKRLRSARVSVAVAAAIIGVALVGGAKWWQSAEVAYRTGLYKPFHVVTSVQAIDSRRVLTLRVDDADWARRRNTPLLPDHGKLMHMFLIRVGDAGVIAHLHPRRLSFDTFESDLPALPSGRYFMFADVVHESGFQRTLVDTIDVGVAPVNSVALTGAHAAAADGDDAWRALAATPLSDVAALASGAHMSLSADALLKAGRDLRLNVVVTDANGAPSALEPYMGMGGHAMVMRMDGGVFVHLHPSGTASMAAQSALMRREAGDSLPTDSASMARRWADTSSAYASARMGGMPGMAEGMSGTTSSSGTLALPFAFPTAGDYRVFVQIKRNGAIETASFKVMVQP